MRSIVKAADAVVSMRLRRLYVIELSDAAGPRDNERFCNLYVGETSLSVAKRCKIHRRGGLYATTVVHDHYRRRRPDLCAGLPTTTDRAQSEANERKHRVYTNGGWLPATESRLEFEVADLEPAPATRLDEALRTVLGEATHGLTPTLCAHLLWGSPGPVIAARGLRDLPQYGRFAHVRHGALVERARQIQSARRLASPASTHALACKFRPPIDEFATTHVSISVPERTPERSEGSASGGPDTNRWR